MNHDFANLIEDYNEQKEIEFETIDRDVNFLYNSKIFKYNESGTECMIQPAGENLFDLPGNTCQMLRVISGIERFIFQDHIPVTKKEFDDYCLSLHSKRKFSNTQMANIIAYYKNKKNFNTNKHHIWSYLRELNFINCVNVIDTNLHIGTIVSGIKDSDLDLFDSKTVLWFIWNVNTIANKYEVYIRGADALFNALKEKLKKNKPKKIIRLINIIDLSLIVEKIRDVDSRSLTIHIPVRNQKRDFDINLMGLYKSLLALKTSNRRFDLNEKFNHSNIIIINDTDNHLDMKNERDKFLRLISDNFNRTIYERFGWEHLQSYLPEFYSGYCAAFKKLRI